MKTTVPAPPPEPCSDAELRAWALSEIRKPVNSLEDFRLRAMLNELLTEWSTDQLLAQFGVAS